MTANRVITFNSTPIVWALIGVTALFCVPKANEYSKEASQISAARAPERAAEREAREKTRTLMRRSDIALDRIATGACIPMVDEETGSPIYFTEAAEAIARQTRQKLTPGTLVCNAFRETAVVGANGELTDFATVKLEDADKYEESFEKLARP